MQTYNIMQTLANAMTLERLTVVRLAEVFATTTSFVQFPSVRYSSNEDEVFVPRWLHPKVHKMGCFGFRWKSAVRVLKPYAPSSSISVPWRRWTTRATMRSGKRREETPNSDGLQPNSFLLLVAMPGAPSSFLLLIACRILIRQESHGVGWFASSHPSEWM